MITTGIMKGVITIAITAITTIGMEMRIALTIAIGKSGVALTPIGTVRANETDELTGDGVTSIATTMIAADAIR